MTVVVCCIREFGIVQLHSSCTTSNVSVCYCPSVIDGSAIAGLERTAVYEEPEAEKENNKEENDSVLKMLMKKTGKYLIERPVRATITLYPIGRPVSHAVAIVTFTHCI